MIEQNKQTLPNGIITFITEGFDGWQAGFEIGVQSFYLQPVSPKKGHEEDTREKAMWYQNCLKHAFKNLSESTSPEPLREALRQIEQMSDPGSYERAIVDMKQIASKALASHTVSGDEQGEGSIIDKCETAVKVLRTMLDKLNLSLGVEAADNILLQIKGYRLMNHPSGSEYNSMPIHPKEPLQ